MDVLSDDVKELNEKVAKYKQKLEESEGKFQPRPPYVVLDIASLYMYALMFIFGALHDAGTKKLKTGFSGLDEWIDAASTSLYISGRDACEGFVEHYMFDISYFYVVIGIAFGRGAREWTEKDREYNLIAVATILLARISSRNINPGQKAGNESSHWSVSKMLGYQKIS